MTKQRFKCYLILHHNNMNKTCKEYDTTLRTKLDLLKEINKFREFGYTATQHLSLGDDIVLITAERDRLRSAFVTDNYKKEVNKKEFTSMCAGLFKVATDFMTENVIWYEYVDPGIKKFCSVCKLELRTGDRCRVEDCDHTAHAECIARYMDRVEKKCPVCKTEIQNKIKLPST